MAQSFILNYNTDLSRYVNELVVETNHNHVSQINASGDMVVDRLSTKHTVTVGFIPLAPDQIVNSGLAYALSSFQNTVQFKNADGEMVTMNCILPSSQIEFYTIRDDKVQLKAFTLTFTEL